jgi:hypothetical protein
VRAQASSFLCSHVAGRGFFSARLGQSPISSPGARTLASS